MHLNIEIVLSPRFRKLSPPAGENHSDPEAGDTGGTKIRLVISESFATPRVNHCFTNTLGSSLNFHVLHSFLSSGYNWETKTLSGRVINDFLRT